MCDLHEPYRRVVLSVVHVIAKRFLRSPRLSQTLLHLHVAVQVPAEDRVSVLERVRQRLGMPPPPQALDLNQPTDITFSTNATLHNGRAPPDVPSPTDAPRTPSLGAEDGTVAAAPVSIPWAAPGGGLARGGLPTATETEDRVRPFPLAHLIPSLTYNYITIPSRPSSSSAFGDEK